MMKGYTTTYAATATVVRTTPQNKHNNYQRISCMLNGVGTNDSPSPLNGGETTVPTLKAQG